ncbi:MAG: coproporphyrinogen III oxidase family protein [Gemmatimonadetes bacterium]|nr:coproporphyrinogen III oxidase family protein [Gemmatimonadota bacterium]
MPRHVYVHVPFCARRCSYCDFSIAVRRTVPVAEYLTALESELTLRFPDRGQTQWGQTQKGQRGGSQTSEPDSAHSARAEDSPTDVDTIYFGGGTPSLLGGAGVARALEMVRARFPLAAGAEVTIEANPDDITAEAVDAWLEAGVNRLSIGSQSFDDAVLAWMHRTHEGAGIERAVAAARAAGIGNLSLDLIFALPAELRRDFTADLDRLLTLEPDHVSLYGLTIEQNTPLGRWVSRGKAIERGEEGYEAEYLTAHEALTAAGLEHYEVSNYAHPGRRSRHNASYWRGVPYVGLGPAAHGFDGRTRRWNLRHYVDWRDALAQRRDPIGGDEQLTEQNRLAESVYLGLWTDAGLPLEEGERDFVGRWEVAQWVTIGADDRLRCTALGWLRLDALAAALTHSRSR